MKKLLSILVVLGLFAGFASAYDCSTLYSRMKTFVEKSEQSNYQSKILLERKNYVNNTYEASVLLRDLQLQQVEEEKLMAESKVLQEEKSRCDARDEEYKNYLRIGGKALSELQSSTTYKPELLETAIENYEKALEVANKSKSTHANVSGLKEQIADFKAKKAQRDKEAEEYNQAVKQAEQQAQIKEQETKDKEVEEAKKALGSKAAIFEGLVPMFKAKDQKTQDNVKALLQTFTQSKDAYTRNIGIYFGYLVK